MFGAFPRDLSQENRETVRDLLVLSIIFFGLSAIAYGLTASWSQPIPRDSTTLVVGRDFLNFWMYGRAALLPDPQLFYDPPTYNAALSTLLGNDYPWQNWSYPPSIMLLATPFGLLPYMTALLIWTALGLAICLAVLSRHVPDRRLLIPIILSPAAVFCLMSGQSSLVTAAMLVTIFAWLDKRPIGAGILIGLLTLKPQLGLLFPIMLIASGRWRVFVSAAITTLLIAGLTAALFGPQVWIDFVFKGLPVQNLVLLDPEFRATPFYPTVFMNVRGTGASYTAAMSVQALFSAFAIAAIAWAYRVRKNADPQWLMALFLACTVCSTPYLLAYDTLTMTIAAVMLVSSAKLDATGRRIAQLVFWLPVMQLGFGMAHIPGPALIAPVFALYVLHRLDAPLIRMVMGAFQARRATRSATVAD